MHISYYPDSDTLYITLNDRPVARTEEINYRCYVELDDEDNPTAFLIEYASQYVEFPIATEGLPTEPAGSGTPASRRVRPVGRKTTRPSANKR
ncbi:MAG: DUF2283 domain-containing protein [Candidatus Lambdaproteobacteria bacterium]|nr:DUF2283 domain-containing protein [Candidatus Lambdaproteobacteria bacterium]